MRFNNFAPVADFINPSFAYRKPANQMCTSGVNISETTDAFEIDILLPGYTKEEVAIKVEGNYLHVSAQKATPEAEQKDRKFNHREFTLPNFKRTFEFPNTVEVGNIVAKQNNGILTLTLPKKAEAKPVNLQIEVQ